MRLALIALAIATATTLPLPLPLQAADKLNILVEVKPCTPIPLPDGGKACEPPKVARVLPRCIEVTIRENGKERKIWVCDESRSPKNPPETPRTPIPVGGY